MLVVFLLVLFILASSVLLDRYVKKKHFVDLFAAMLLLFDALVYVFGHILEGR